MEEPTTEDVALAARLLQEWDEGRGTSKSQIEIREWGDATSHGRRFDRFILRTLGVQTSRPSKQSARIADLERQLRGRGWVPPSAPSWEVQLQHGRNAAFAALRIWNDPTSSFRTGSFSLLFVTAWNSLSIAILQRQGEEWRELDDQGKPALYQGREKAKEVLDLLAAALPGDHRRGLRENVRFWVGLRNQVAHRHLPALDAIVIPYAQAGLLNFEETLGSEFGEEYLLGESLSVPLQLSGFRDPGLLASLKRMQASLPLDVQAFLADAASASPELLSDPSYILRVAFVPAVPASGRSPDAIAYFVRPGEVPDELAEALDRFVVLPKVARPARPNLGAKHVVAEVQSRIPFRFTVNMHATVTRRLEVRPEANAIDPAVTDPRFCEYVPAVKLHLYNQAWVDRLVKQLSTVEGFREAVGIEPVSKDGG
jgi:hypothetical protein